jgi:hypothetical protein
VKEPSAYAPVSVMIAVGFSFCLLFHNDGQQERLQPIQGSNGQPSYVWLTV